MAGPTTADMHAVFCEIRDILKSQDTTLKHLLALSESRMAKAATNGKAVASDRELDGQYGDPVIVAKDPKDWTGAQMAGKRLSECPPAYLDQLADRYDWFNTTLDRAKPEDAKKIGYNTRDAARARGWAQRLRSGWKAPDPTAAPVTAGSNPFADDNSGDDSVRF